MTATKPETRQSTFELQLVGAWQSLSALKRWSTLVGPASLCMLALQQFSTETNNETGF